MSDVRSVRQQHGRGHGTGAGLRMVPGIADACSLLARDPTLHDVRYASHQCRAALLRAAGCEISYEAILVLSGHATSFAYHPQRYGALFVTPDPSDVTDRRIGNACGYTWERLGQADGGLAAWEIVRASIDAHRPLQGVWIDDIVIGGYDDPVDGARRIWVAGGWDVPGWWDWERFDKWSAEFGQLERVGEPCATIEPLESLREVVACMVRCTDDDPRKRVPALAHASYGLEGVLMFAEDVGNMAHEPDYWYPGWMGGYCVYKQIEGRGIAAAYLEASASLGGPTPRVHLMDAAAHFRQARDAWRAWGSALGAETGAADPEELRVRWWKPACRRDAALRIREAYRWEAEAARSLRLALASMGPNPGSVGPRRR